VFTGQFHDSLAGLQGFFDPWHAIFLQIFELSQDALGHEHQRLVLKDFLQLGF